MKISAQQYAQSLYEATKEKSQSEVDLALGNFVGILAKNRQLKNKKNIIQKFGEIYNSENNIVSAEVVSREKLSSSLVDKLNSFIKNKYQAKEAVIENKIDAGVKGGIIIKIKDEIIDMSLERQLRELKKQLSF